MLNVDLALVLGRIPELVRLGQDSPNFHAKTQRIRQDLEHHIPIVRPVTVPSRGRERKGVRGVVRKIETALDVEAGIAGVGQSGSPRFDQGVNFRLGSGLGLEFTDACEIFQLRRWNLPSPE